MTNATYIDEKKQKHQWGVGCIILNDSYQTLLLQRKDNGLWGTPGGGVELGESALDAVYREVKEETGLDIKYPVFLGSFQTYNENVVWTSFAFFTEYYSGHIKPQLSEVTQIKWVHLSEVFNYELFNASRCGLELLQNAYPDLFRPTSPILNVNKKGKNIWLLEKIIETLNLSLSVEELSSIIDNMDDDDIDSMMRNIGLLEHSDELKKMTSIDQALSIKNPGSDGGIGHYDSSGRWIYDKPKKDKNKTTASQQNTVNPINILKQSYIYYFSRNKQWKALYEVKDGQFVFPDYNSAVKQGIAKDKKSYFTLFKEQYILFALNNKNSKK